MDLLQRDHLPAPDLGFALLPEYQGQGYGFEACEAVLEDARNEHNINQILAITAPDNTISQKLASKTWDSKIGINKVHKRGKPRCTV